MSLGLNVSQVGLILVGATKNAVDFWFPEQEGAELSKIINQSNQSSVLEWRPLYGFTLVNLLQVVYNLLNKVKA